MQKYVLHNEDGLKWVMIGRDANKPDDIIDTNEYLIISGDEAMMLDPGGVEIFPPVLTAVSELIDVKKIKAYLCSHEDPDIMSSLPLWLGLTPNARIHLSWLWRGFVAHFGREFTKNFALIPDEGQTIELGGRSFTFVPAHHCHASGNFNLFDPESRILFSGDMGSGLVPPDYSVFVEDFDAHIRYMEDFHRRWMPSNDHKAAWIKRVRKLEPKMICPQHGSVFTGENVGKFLDWLDDLEVGVFKKAI